MKTDELREKYLAFFESHGCVRKPSDVLVPNDPTVLFTPAGMNQFKNQFLGIGPLEFTRATTCQKCLRTGDIDNVGVTAYHHTFFEMLGNFSFGDYFKREAINWAWEFLTEKKWLGLDPDKLSVTVYEDDDEAFAIWQNDVKLSPERIQRNDEVENFWPAGAPSQGPDGVCGPCSEIYFHPGGGRKEVEIWNLVFTQFNRVGAPPDNLRPLPKKNIDTGMGLERTAAVLQGVVSNFEIDILAPICKAAGEAVGVKYSFDSPHGRALRRIADHLRAVTFCIHEEVGPGSEKQSYVVRQLLRRAVLEGYLIGHHDVFLSGLVPAVVKAMEHAYPDIRQTAGTVAGVIREEEKQFLQTLDRGLARFDKIVEKAKNAGASVISGDDAFDMHQTDGFLIELTVALAARKNMTVDLPHYRHLMEEHKVKSGTGVVTGGVMAEGPLDAIRKTSGGTEFLGYESTSSDATIVGIIAAEKLVDEVSEIGHASEIAVVLDRTPFYGKAGGQEGDRGTLSNANCEFAVLNTLRDHDLILHVGHLKKGKLEVGQKLSAKIDTDRRAGVRRAHSATHILHHALQKTLGENARQRGSKVEDDVLRFDFAHRAALTLEEVRQVEDIINARIAEGAPVTTELMPIEAARKAGAMALFGEKYPDRVRVVSMGAFSKELCGGTHLSNTGQVGFCKIVSEEPIGKGERRITAFTGQKAVHKIRESEDLLRELVLQLKTPQPEDLPKRIHVLQEELKEAQRSLSQFTKQSVSGEIDQLVASAISVGGAKIVTHQTTDGQRDTLRQYVDQLREKLPSAAILLGAVVDGKVALIAAVSKDLIQRGVKAGDCVKAAAAVVGGGGGGRPDMAEAGGKDPGKLPEALKAGEAFYRSKLG